MVLVVASCQATAAAPQKFVTTPRAPPTTHTHSLTCPRRHSAGTRVAEKAKMGCCNGKQAGDVSVEAMLKGLGLYDTVWPLLVADSDELTEMDCLAEQTMEDLKELGLSTGAATKVIKAAAAAAAAAAARMVSLRPPRPLLRAAHPVGPRLSHRERPAVRGVRERPCTWLVCMLLSLVKNPTFWRIPRAPHACASRPAPHSP